MQVREYIHASKVKRDKKVTRITNEASCRSPPCRGRQREQSKKYRDANTEMQEGA